MTTTTKPPQGGDSRDRLKPIYEATAIPVRLDGSLPQQPSESFTLIVEPERAQEMSEATQDVVGHLGVASFECKALEIKGTDGKGMVLRIDRIHRNGAVVPFVCPKWDMEEPALLGVRAPKRGWQLNPSRFSWGVLSVSEDGLVFLFGATTFLGS